MDIFYLKKSEFLPNIDPNSLKKFSDGRIFKSKDKEEEHFTKPKPRYTEAKLIKELEDKNIDTSWQKGKSEGLLYSITLLENEFDY